MAGPSIVRHCRDSGPRQDIRMTQPSYPEMTIAGGWHATRSIALRFSSPQGAGRSRRRRSRGRSTYSTSKDGFRSYPPTEPPGRGS